MTVKEGIRFLEAEGRIQEKVNEECFNSKRLQGFDEKLDLMARADLTYICSSYWDMDEHDDKLKGTIVFESKMRVVFRSKEGILLPLGNCVTYIDFDDSWLFKAILMDTGCAMTIKAVSGDRMYLMPTRSWREFYRQLNSAIKLENGVREGLGMTTNQNLADLI